MEDKCREFVKMTFDDFIKKHNEKVDKLQQIREYCETQKVYIFNDDQLYAETEATDILKDILEILNSGGS